MQYLSTIQLKALERAYRLSAILALVFCFTPVLLLGLGWLLPVPPSTVIEPEQAVFFNKAVYGAALLAGLLVVALRRLWQSVVLRGSQPLDAVLRRLRLRAVLSGALGELVAILGFVAFSLTGNYQFCWRLAVVGLLLILYSFPRRAEWAQAVAAHAQEGAAA